MTRKKKTEKSIAVETYKHETAKRKNIPTAKIAAEGTVPRVGKAKYAYSAHLPPQLLFDSSGRSDRLTEIVEKTATGNKLTKEEIDILRSVAANASQPWLEWANKKEEHKRGVLEVEPVALHIHERVSASAIIRAAKRKEVQAELFADPQQEYKEAIQFYMHDVDWANRLILGDSLEVMSSLAKREDLGGKVQMIYMDPPYGIKFSSNFQSEVSKRDVGDKETDITREAEMVKAYRDTWHLGVHSYLTYLRDRLLVAKDLLSETGSIFVQISDENLHRVRQILDESFGPENFCSIIAFRTTTGKGAALLDSTFDFLLWYARDIAQVKFHKLYEFRSPKDDSNLRWVRIPSGEDIRVADPEDLIRLAKEQEGRIYRPNPLTSQSGSESTTFEYLFEGKMYSPSKGGWKTNLIGMERLAGAGRLIGQGNTLSYRRYLDDFIVKPSNNVWDDTRGSGFGDVKRYVVETNTRVIERCLLMTTGPGDLILDPTCGSGTSALVAEKWGRRWITADSSRVAISLARQRLLTASFFSYSLKAGLQHREGADHIGLDPSSGFVVQTVPYVTLKGIARNSNLDAVFEKYGTKLDECLDTINNAVKKLTEVKRIALLDKLAGNLQQNGIRSVSVAQRRRLLLPGLTKEQIASAFSTKPRLKNKHIDNFAQLVPPNGKFEHWNVPLDADELWSEELKSALSYYREVWLARATDIDACISENAEQVDLVDRPNVDSGKVRVSGPFTVEGVRPEELSLDENGELFDPTPNDWEVNDGRGEHAQNASAYLDRMLQLIGQDGVTFPNNEHRKFTQIERLEESDSALHAEALWEDADDRDVSNVAIAFGPQHGPVTASQVEDLIRASRRYDELVIAAFSFDGSSQAVIQESANPRLKIHMAHIRPDVSPGMDGLLKDSPKSQLFTVFGQPEIKVHQDVDDYKVELLGVDIYSPLTGDITSSGADKVAAWFLDSDYDGRCFCITQAFFPNQKVWVKIAKALGSSSDAAAFDAYNGTLSVPFKRGDNQRIAVKVIDPRGNDVMAIRSLKDVD